MKSGKNRLLGAHMSVSGGCDKSIDRGVSIGCTAIQIFTGFNNRWQSKAISSDILSAFDQKRSKVDIVFAHNNYLVNLASPDPVIASKSFASMLDEVARAGQLSLPYLIIHPGAHMGAGEKRGVHLVAQRLNELIDQTNDSDVRILLETTSGQGTVLGSTFEHLAEIIANIKDQKRIGICFDTCHVFTSGYDIRTPEAYEKTFSEFDRIAGLDYLKVFHLNDSKHDIGTKKDRHEHIGDGYLGLSSFELLLNDYRFFSVPMVLETPKSDFNLLEEDKKNLAVLRALIK
ncbi:MAG: deoxyribonuclease IV [Candidatus Margulisiibacteriota bacterium]|nr:MAG: hypothetical protein A2X43_05110 [Candidatus Margulisbacteria bacterium GWD2_39_127]OGI02351.1 MAG: hypothetical protein A2X42_09360 [Candidatus Margulisbacteria bacterium GWF2_38_17]OGI08484.1 MAG: hypothetical protein A2X41_07150 [Candidatus Margulisbacteria bacterium GWE2_39_32]PZM78996.1 MAG: deoxyribonuclease IV [Candidatus Margulisiibacteriota bacterium]HAR64226.1 deoxyribonuclease IV [Candidatus Margulisiibacteriota bacterium]